MFVTITNFIMVVKDFPLLYLVYFLQFVYRIIY